MTRILLIDDDADFRELTRMTFERSGLRVTLKEAFDGRSALRMISAEDFDVDLILLDLNMPRMDGFEFLQAYASEAKKLFPVVVLTGADGDPLRRRAMSYSFVKEFFEKPLTTGDVHELTEIAVQLY